MNIKQIIREEVLTESVKPTQDDGLEFIKTLPNIYEKVKELAKPKRGVRTQKLHLEKLSNFLHNIGLDKFEKEVEKYNRKRWDKHKKPMFKLEELIGEVYSFMRGAIKFSNTPNNQIDGAINYLELFPEETKEWSEKEKNIITKMAKEDGGNSFNFFQPLLREYDLVAIASNIEFLYKLRDEYNISLRWLPID